MILPPTSWSLAQTMAQADAEAGDASDAASPLRERWREVVDFAATLH